MTKNNETIKSDKVCRFFMDNKCKFTNNCRYKHDNQYLQRIEK